MCLLMLTHFQLHLLKGAAVRLVVCIPGNLESAITQFSSYYPTFPLDLNLLICLCPLIYFVVSCASVCILLTCICVSFPILGPDHEAQFDPECRAHSQSNQRVCEKTRLHLRSQTGAH